jgi:hypothetical protein
LCTQSLISVVEKNINLEAEDHEWQGEREDEEALVKKEGVDGVARLCKVRKAIDACGLEIYVSFGKIRCRCGWIYWLFVFRNFILSETQCAIDAADKPAFL